MVLGEAFLLSLGLSALAVSVVFGLAYVKNRRYDLIDSSWGLLFIIIATSNYLLIPDKNWLNTVVWLMVLAWGLRLTIHIFKRWLQSAEVDRRYADLQAKWPPRARSLQMYFRVYLFQALLATLISLTVIVIQAGATGSILTYMGLTVWVAGFVFEVVADRQLRDFLAKPPHQGKLMTRGLWRYSRHPNYFGEVTLWWGMALIALSSPYGWLGLVGAGVITVLILFVSGVPPAERSMSKKPGWQSYKTTTSLLVPLPPKSLDL
jgi:steroid 5-alpha reductase family enzyme